MRILVVEDEVRLAAHLKRGLEAEGFAVDVAQTGTDGLWMAREQPYDAVVLGHHAAGSERLQWCASTIPQGEQLGPHPHAHREGW